MNAYNTLQPNDLVGSVGRIQQIGGELKVDLFKAMLKNEEPDKSLRERYLAKVYSFLTSWRDIAERLQEQIRHSSGREGVSAIKHNSVRDYIYAKYDYASILLFIDGVFKGVAAHKFETPADVEDFRKSVCAKAFRNRDDTVGGLVDETIGLETEYDGSVGNVAEAKLYDSFKSQSVFQKTDSRELYKSIEEAIKFVFFSKTYGPELPENGMLRVAIINSIIEQATYSMAAYATRIYAISAYATPYIQANKEYTEAVEEFSLKVGASRVMAETEEGVARDWRNHFEFIEKLKSFLVAIGASDDIVDHNHEDDCISKAWNIDLCRSTGNVFVKATVGNPLVEFIFKYMNGPNVAPNWYDSDKHLDDVCEQMQKFLRNGKVGYQYTSTPMNELMILMGYLEPEGEGLESLQKFTGDTVKFFGAMLGIIRHLIDEKFTERDVTITKYRESQNRNLADIRDMMAELYRNIGTTLLYRTRDLEERINLIRMSDQEEKDAMLDIYVPGKKKRGPILSHSVFTVPVTTRVPPEIINLYSSPALDELNMYDEVAKILLPGDPFYFNEAGDDEDEGILAKIWNAIVAFFTGIAENIRHFLDSASFKASVKWVKEHKEKLQTMSYEAPLKVKDYKEKINFNLSGIQDPLSRGFTKESLKDDKSLDQYIKTIYFNDDGLMRFFRDENTDGGVKIRAYQNHILFNGVALQTSSADKEPTIELKTPDQIRSKVNSVWVPTVLDSTDALEKLYEQTKKFTEIIEECKKKSAEWSKEATEDDKAGSSDSAAPNMTEGEGQNPQPAPASPAPTPGAANPPPATGAGKAMIGKGIKEMTLATRNLWNATHMALLMAVKDQYKYIQVAYENAKKKTK